MKCGNHEQILCIETLLPMFGITKARLRRITQLVFERSTSTCARRSDRREDRSISDELKVQMTNHFSSFPYRVAHYGKTQRKIRYLISQLSIHKMWTYYLQLYEPDTYLAAKQNNMSLAKPRVKYEFFLRYYKKHFDYIFGRPSVDVCATLKKLSRS